MIFMRSKASRSIRATKRYISKILWVQDVFAGEGPENLQGIANFDRQVDDDEVEAGDLVSAPSI